MKPRIRDIAAAAKVSPATVSNALNGRSGVSKALAERIVTLAHQMGYAPGKPRAETGSHYVRLVVYKSHGLVVKETEFFAGLLESIQLECQQAGLELIISHIHTNKDCYLRIRDICAEECAGILLIGTEMNSEELQLFQGCRSPLVVLDNLFRSEKVHSVVMNNYDAGYQATCALYQAGHRRIDHITSSQPFSNNYYRRKGYEAAMAACGLPFSDKNLWPVAPSIEDAYEDMKALLQKRSGALPTAFFAANDLMALGAIRALTEAGYHIPEDVSIIGMDDIAGCIACIPPLSTIRVDRRELGKVAVRTLLNLAPAMKDCVVKTEISVELIQRYSVRRLND